MQVTRKGRRFLVGTAAIAVTTGLLVSTSPAGADPIAPTPVPAVTAGQLQAAKNNKEKQAQLLGQFSAVLAQAQSAEQQAQGRMNLAEQQVALAVSRRVAAEQADKVAQANLVQSRANTSAAHQRFVQYLQASYTNGDVAGTGGALLTASDPSTLLEQSMLQQYENDHHATVLSQFQTAMVSQSNAEAKARQAVAARKAAEAESVKVEQQAAIVVAQSQQQVKQAQQTVNQTQAQLTAAEATYATTALGRAKYTQYEQAYASYQQQMAQLAAERAAAAAAAAAARARQQQQQNNGGGGGNNSGGGGGGVSGGGGPPPSGGSWTAAAGQQAANRALSWLGEPYIWAGGNQWGPTDGGCTDPIAPCGTLGFDCSGLVLYAWAQGWAHYAATQYWQAGSYHPSPGNFMPGDLLFWSEDGTEGGIGHVAIYIGNGNVVQAPESGDVVKITPWDEVESGYYGATRPLT